METESLARFVIENPNLFLNQELSDEDKNILKNIFIYKERLLDEIKVIFCCCCCCYCSKQAESKFLIIYFSLILKGFRR